MIEGDEVTGRADISLFCREYYPGDIDNLYYPGIIYDMESTPYTVFEGTRLVASGELAKTLREAKSIQDANENALLLFFNDETGEQVDFDLRGTIEEALGRMEPPKPKTGPGRPSMGVVCREVALLPRHWEWLERQQKNISATLRRLVDDAIRNEPVSAKARRALEAADRALWALAGDLPNCEEASRALYSRDFATFRGIVRDWPQDIAVYLSRMAGRAE